MSDRGVARRYAGALFDIAEKAGRADQAAQELSELIGIIEGHPDLKHVLETPTVPASAKKEILSALLAKVGRVSDEVSRLVLMLADRDRLSVLRELQAAYTVRLQEAQRIVPAEVVTATPLSEATRSSLLKALGTATGRTVTLKERVDPAIMGGIIARVGSMVFDGSVSRQLERLRQQLTTNN